MGREDIMLLQIKNLRKYYPISKSMFRRQKGIVKAVDGIDLAIEKGQTVGLVGESGCGKTTVGKIIVKLLEEDSGKVYFNGKDISNLNQREFIEFRSKIQIVFQDPFSSLDPRFKVSQTITETLKALTTKPLKKRDIKELVCNLIEQVGLSPDKSMCYPHQLSGGERQRVGIARAISSYPEFIVLDEPVSSLDVFVSAKIISLLLELQKKMGLSYLFISHDLNVVRCVSNVIYIMYLGKIVEFAPKDELFSNPLHPYTKVLLDAIPRLMTGLKPIPTRLKEDLVMKGEISSSAKVPHGCVFHPRCIHAKEECSHIEPELKLEEAEHYVRCHLVVW